MRFGNPESTAVITTDRQVRMIMNELSKRGNQEKAAAKAGVCRQTAAKYQRLGKLPSELKAGREWRTRPDNTVELTRWRTQCFYMLLN